MSWTTRVMALAAPLATVMVGAALLMIDDGATVGWLVVPLFAVSPFVAAITWRDVPPRGRIGVALVVGIVAAAVVAATYWQPLLHPGCVYGTRGTPWEVALPVVVAGAIFAAGWAAAALLASTVHAGGRPWLALSVGAAALLGTALASTLVAFVIGGGLCNRPPV